MNNEEDALRAYQLAAIDYATLCDLMHDYEPTEKGARVLAESRERFRAAQCAWHDEVSR